MSQKWVQGKLFSVKKTCTKCGVEKPLDKFHFRCKRDNIRHAKCSDCVRESNRKWRSDNREKEVERHRKWRSENREKSRECHRKWYAANKEKSNALGAKYAAAKIHRTPKWLTKEHYKQMEDMYIKAHWLPEQTGVKYNVDHIIPLQGDNVSGLHVPWNLQVITAAENFSKGNKFDGMNIPCLGISIPINSKKVKVMQ